MKAARTKPRADTLTPPVWLYGKLYHRYRQAS